MGLDGRKGDLRRFSLGAKIPRQPLLEKDADTETYDEYDEREMPKNKKSSIADRLSEHNSNDLQPGLTRRTKLLEHADGTRKSGIFSRNASAKNQTGTRRSSTTSAKVSTPQSARQKISSQVRKQASRIPYADLKKYTRRRTKFAFPFQMKTGKGRIFKYALVATLLILVVGTLAASLYAYTYYQSQAGKVNQLASSNQLFQTTNIYDRNGSLLFSLYDQGRRTYVQYDQISHWLVDATVATEDRTFWTNDGVDLWGIVRAALHDVTSHNTPQGASTITQQLVKNQIVGSKVDIQRKLQEAILSYGVAHQYPKTKIMEMYLNIVNYSNLNYGVEAASEGLFGLSPKYDAQQHRMIMGSEQLDLAQASLLAGIPQSPTYYDPIMYPDNALNRQQQVLRFMVETHSITQDQANAAEAEGQQLVKNMKPYPHTKLAPHFIDYVIQDVLIPSLGSDTLADSGLQIYTTLDLSLEQQVEQEVYNQLYTPQYEQFIGHVNSLAKQRNVNNGAVVVIEPRTGEILAMDGSADVHSTDPKVAGQTNAAITGRPPGSSFKPVVYATAFTMGWDPGLVINDSQRCYPDGSGGCYSPHNYGYTFHGPHPIRFDLDNSFNIPAVDAAEFAGVPNVLTMAQRMGITDLGSDPSQHGLAMALGADNISLLQMTSAYSTFANNGERVAPASILQINDSQGHVIYKYDPAGLAQQVMSPQVAYLMNNILEDTRARSFEFGINNPLDFPGRPVAAKTGTSDDFKDNLTIGYTPYLTVGVWVGNSDDSAMNNVVGITGAGPIFHNVLDWASKHYNLPSTDFPVPSGMVKGIVSARTGMAPYQGGNDPTEIDWFINGTLPAHD